MQRREIVVPRPDCELAGSIWLPNAAPEAPLIVMHPGSGPSDRDNDTLFPPIRERFLAGVWAVASFDKRGVGGSTGAWTDADIAAQAQDAVACVAACRDAVPATSAGLFGHSQGGWVVLQAAAHGAAVDFVITNSGPGVTPREQEMFATRQGLQGCSVVDADAALAAMAELFDLAARATPWPQVRAWLADPARAAVMGILAEIGAFVPADAALWGLTVALIDHDPRAAMPLLTVPILTVFGANDTAVPVEASVDAYRRHVRPDLLTVAVLDGDHRLEAPDSAGFAPGYLSLLADFVAGRSRQPSPG
jgi:hypothetical protein